MWLPPKVWLHGSQSSSTGGSSSTKEQPDAANRLVRAQHALGVDDALGLTGRAGGEEELCERVRTDLGVAASTAGVASAATVRERRHRPVAPRSAVAATSTSAGTRRCDRACEGLAVRDEHQAGRQCRDDGLEFLEILRDQRIGRRDWRIGNADVHGRKTEQRVLQIVAGQNRNRALRRKVAREQSRRDGAHLRIAFAHRSACATRPRDRAARGTPGPVRPPPSAPAAA